MKNNLNHIPKNTKSITSSAGVTVAIRKWIQELKEKGLTGNELEAEIEKKYQDLCKKYGIVNIENCGINQSRFGDKEIIFRITTKKELDEKTLNKLFFTYLHEPRKFISSPTPFDSYLKYRKTDLNNGKYIYLLKGIEPYTD